VTINRNDSILAIDSSQGLTRRFCSRIFLGAGLESCTMAGHTAVALVRPSICGDPQSNSTTDSTDCTDGKPFSFSYP
jgi:hypothetical protein